MSFSVLSSPTTARCCLRNKHNDTPVFASLIMWTFRICDNHETLCMYICTCIVNVNGTCVVLVCTCALRIPENDTLQAYSISKWKQHKSLYWNHVNITYQNTFKINQIFYFRLLSLKKPTHITRLYKRFWNQDNDMLIQTTNRICNDRRYSYNTE